MYPSFNDFDRDSYLEYLAHEADSREFEGEDSPSDIIAGIEIRGSEPEDDWNGEDLPF